MSKFIFTSLATSVALFGLSGTAMAASGTGASTAKILTPLTITPVDELDFGKFAPDGSGNTIVDMDQTGAVTCMGASLCGADSPKAGSFNVSGTPNQAVHLSSPGNFFLYNGSNTVEIGNGILSGAGVTVQSYFSSNAVLNSSGALTFKYTGSLWMTAGTPQGDYSGNYTVVVNYQ